MKRYNLTTIEELIAVATPENIDNLTTDLTSFLNAHVRVRDIDHLEMGKTFCWLDNGTTGVSRIIVNVVRDKK